MAEHGLSRSCTVADLPCTYFEFDPEFVSTSIKFQFVDEFTSLPFTIIIFESAHSETVGPWGYNPPSRCFLSLVATLVAAAACASLQEESAPCFEVAGGGRGMIGWSRRDGCGSKPKASWLTASDVNPPMVW